MKCYTAQQRESNTMIFSCDRVTGVSACQTLYLIIYCTEVSILKFMMEWLDTNPVILGGKYRIECLSSATFPGALRVIKESFCQDEYVSIGTEVNKNPVAADELLELCADTALDGVSLVAVENDTNEVVSVAFNKIQVQSLSVSEKPFFEIFAEERCTQESSRSLIQCMATLDGRCNFFDKLGVDCSLEIMFLATLRDHRHKKLGLILCKTSVELARRIKDGPVTKFTVQDLGPKYSMLKSREQVKPYPKICQAIWTTTASQKIGKTLNFNVHLTVPLKEFIYEGKPYTDRIGDDHAFCEVVALALY